MSYLLRARKFIHSKATCHWRYLLSGGVALRKGFVLRLGLPLKAYKFIQSVAGQNYVGYEVTLRIGTKGETIPGFSAPSKRRDVYTVTKLY
jgi:hypothetical protein